MIPKLVRVADLSIGGNFRIVQNGVVIHRFPNDSEYGDLPIYIGFMIVTAIYAEGNELVLEVQ